MRVAGVGFDSAGAPLVERDVCRVVERDESTFVALCDASGAPFERYTPALSREVLDRVEEGMAGNVNGAIDAARAAMVALGDPEADAWILLAQIASGRIGMRWAGMAEAWLVHGERVVERARGHTARFPGNPEGVATRGLGASWKRHESALWRFEAGARLVCVNPSVARLPDDEVHRIAIVGAATDAARALVAAAIARDPQRHAAAVVVEL